MERENKEQQEQTVILKDEALKRFQGGFTAIPNVILENTKITLGARMTYAMLLKYAWQKDFCFPAHKRIAKDLGVSERSVRTFLDELRGKELIEWKRRGLTLPNIYYILALPSPDNKKPLINQGTAISAVQERQPTSVQERQPASYKEYSKNNTKYVNVSNDTPKTGEWSPVADPALAPLSSNGNESGQNGKAEMAELMARHQVMEAIFNVFPQERVKKISVNFFRKVVARLPNDKVLAVLSTTKYDTLVDPSSKGTAKNPAAIFTNRLKELAGEQGIQL